MCVIHTTLPAISTFWPCKRKRVTFLSYITVPPKMKFDLPPIHYLPAELQVECQVAKAYPNFYMILKVGDEETFGPIYGEKRLDTVFTGAITRNMKFSEGKQQTQVFECAVVWMRETSNETLAIRRIISFHCEYII